MKFNKYFIIKDKSSHFTEDEIKELFIKAYNLVRKNKDQKIEDTIEVFKILTDKSSLDERIATLQSEMENNIKRSK